MEIIDCRVNLGDYKFIIFIITVILLFWFIIDYFTPFTVPYFIALWLVLVGKTRRFSPLLKSTSGSLIDVSRYKQRGYSDTIYSRRL